MELKLQEPKRLPAVTIEDYRELEDSLEGISSDKGLTVEQGKSHLIGCISPFWYENRLLGKGTVYPWILSVARLGFMSPATMHAIVERGELLGLKGCPIDVALEVRRTYTHPTHNERLTAAGDWLIPSAFSSQHRRLLLTLNNSFGESSRKLLSAVVEEESYHRKSKHKPRRHWPSYQMIFLGPEN